MQDKYRSIIVDDEELARKDLRNVLAKFNNLEIVGEAANLKEAEQLLRLQKPDIVFLDIQFPGESGFQLLDKISQNTHVIFVTAYDRYAIRAFEVNALDYLLKPVNPERLQNALDKLDIARDDRPAAIEKLNYDDSIFLMFGSKYSFLKVSSILAIRAAEDYTEVVTTALLKGITSKTMKEWERRLPDRRFIRIHRSVIINSDYIERIEDWFNYSYRIFMKGIDKPFVMSKRYAQLNKSKLG